MILRLTITKPSGYIIKLLGYLCNDIQGCIEMIQRVRGFRDILPGEIGRWQAIERLAAEVFENFGFKEIRIPILEKTDLFSRSIGKVTDIVEKEMYTFTDRSGDMLTLRPEATAAVARAYLQNKLYTADPVQKLYTIGPMFRRERPQKGRYRQFYQINAEVIGVAAPTVDAQLIIMLLNLMEKLRVPDLTVQINTLGDGDCRPKFQEALGTFLASISDGLCEDCQRRRTENPLRVLDCKNPACQALLEKVPTIHDFLCDACRNHFETTCNLLDQEGIDYHINDRLVRGLDYYTRTTFEIQTRALGAKSAVAGGGRYDGLMKIIGGPQTPATGFAIGLDRLAEIVESQWQVNGRQPVVFVAALGDDAHQKAFSWVNRLNREGIYAEMDFSSRSLKSQMKQANRFGAGHVLIVGENELTAGNAILRDMAASTQEEVLVDRVVEIIEKIAEKRGKEVNTV